LSLLSVNVLLLPALVNVKLSVLDVITHGSEEASDRSIDVYIAQLRKKIEKTPARPVFIKSIRGFGYMFSKTHKKQE